MGTTIAAVATPAVDCAISIIRISGPDAHKIANRVFSLKKGGFPKSANRMCYGSFYAKDGALLDEGMAVLFFAPHSYTGEDAAEFYTHGGVHVTNLVFQSVLDAGAKPAQAGEYTRRAYLNGKMDLTEAEAVIDLINAKSEAAVKSAALQLRGGLYEKVEEIEAHLLDADSVMMALIDFPEEGLEDPDLLTLKGEITKAAEKIDALLKTSLTGRAVREGVSAAIVGKPNVGKSSFMNLLSGKEHSIVTSIPGTTRDVVAHSVKVGDFVLCLSDTAGIRRTDDLIEREGVRRAENHVKEASLLFALFDGASPLTGEDERVIALCEGKRAIAIINKADLGCIIDKRELERSFQSVLPLCAKSGEGLDEIIKQVNTLYAPAAGFDYGEAMVASYRHEQLLKDAKESVLSALSLIEQGFTIDLIALETEEALRSLGTITGKTVSEEVIDQIFSRFCVGK